MTATVVLDVFESRELEVFLSQWNLQVVRQNLVPLGLADIYWMGHGGTKFTLEHKTIEQVLSEMGQRLDDQLRKHTQHADDVGLVYNGFATPRPGGGCDLWRRTQDGKFFRKHGYSKAGYEELCAYLWRLDKEGITVYGFPDLESMAMGIASFVFNSLKAEHKTLRRYVKSRPVLWEPDPYIETLIGVSGAGVGEKTARRILMDADFGTPWGIFSADAQVAIPKLGRGGRGLFLGIMRGIGRRVF